MRLQIVKSKNAASLYIVKSVFVNGKRTSKVVEKLGTFDELKKTHEDPIAWGQSYAQALTEKEKSGKKDILVKYSQSKRLDIGQQHSFNGGYLFLQSIYHELKLHDLCKEISKQYKFTFNLDSILSRLIFGRILFPASKLSTLQFSHKLLEQPAFDIQHIYRALEVIAKETDFIQAELYKNSLSISNRNTGLLYYDCTNYFFEIEQEEGLKQYGISKEHRPNPIVQMGLFMDGDGIPLAFRIHKGNTNEQLTLKPLEETIMKDFHLSRFIVCTDAGLASNDNRRFNNQGERAFITTQSLKKLKKHLKEWALAPNGWSLAGSSSSYNLRSLEDTDQSREFFKDKTFYKERWITENGLEQKLIVTYSLKHRDYQRQVRLSQIERASRLIETNPGKLKKSNSNDYKRLISKSSITVNGELASKDILTLNMGLVAAEEAFDGFYAVCTNLEDCAPDIIRINHRRWEIEESFRIMKTEFKSRPVYLSRDDRIVAHFTTCFLALAVYRILEKKLKEAYTCSNIIQTLRDMNFYELPGEGYVPTYTRTELTDALHDTFGFHTDYQIISNRQMKKIWKATKK